MFKLFKVISLDFNLNFMQLSTFPYFLFIQNKLFFLRRFKLSSKAKTVQPYLNREKQNFEIICRVFCKKLIRNKKDEIFCARSFYYVNIVLMASENLCNYSK